MSFLKKLLVCLGLASALAITGWSMADDKAPAAPAQPSAQAPAKPEGEGKEIKKGGKKEDNDDVQEEHEDKGGKHEGKEADDD